MAEVLNLPLHCPLCDGEGMVPFIVEDGVIDFTQCGLCRGTGKRPTDTELGKRRAGQTTPEQPK